MEVQEILSGKEKLISYLKEKGFKQEKEYSDDEYKEGTYFKIDRRKLLVVYEIFDEEKIKEIKDHFLIDRGLSYCTIIFDGKLIFFRNFGETKHFIYSERTKNNVSKIDKLNNISVIDSLFQSKDISALFYEAFKVKRNLLVQNIKNDVEPVQKYLIAQKIFDRFFFIYFLCHKGIIKFKDGGKISGESLFTKILLKKGKFLENLKKLFHLFNSQEKNILEIGDYQIVIPYLNGGLFRPDVLEQDLDIKLKDEQWEEIFEFLNSYHWIIEDVKATEENEEKILTPEILGHVYERSVVEWESEGFEKEAENTVKKITERKKKGVYYTPESITDYISNSTIIPYLLDKLGNKYTSFEELIESKNKKDMKEALKILDEIKVLDPACGSGAFLIKASEVILSLKRRLNYEIKEKKNFYDLKLDIITENIYGVDILAGAIEISKLRLWLWLISDFEESKNEIKALPNIEYNLKVGNSLVGWLDEKLVQMPMNTPLTEKVDGIFTGLIAFSENGYGEELKKARELLRAYKLTDYIEAYYILYKIYRRTHGLKAENLRSILETIRKSIYATVTPAFLDYVNKKIKPNYDSKKPPITQEEFSELQVFHWRIDFGHIILNGGFDVVIANPPYIQKNAFRDFEKKLILQQYPENSSNMNIAAVFISQINRINKQEGFQGVIVPKSLTFSKFWLDDRRRLLERILKIMDVSKAFKDVLLEQIVFTARKFQTGKKYEIIGYHEGIIKPEVYLEKDYCYDLEILLSSINKKELDIFKIIKQNSTNISKITKTFCGLPYQADLTEKGDIPAIGGKEIGRYKLKGIKGYFSKSYLKNEDLSLFKKEKIVTQDIVAHVTKPNDRIILMSSFDNTGIVTVNTVNNTYLVDNSYNLKSICVLLNSKIVSWIHYRFTFNRAIRTMHFYEFFLSKTRIPINFKEHSTEIGYLYDYVVNSNEEQSMKIDHLINLMAYELFFSQRLDSKLILNIKPLIKDITNLSNKKKLEEIDLLLTSIGNANIKKIISGIESDDFIVYIEGLKND